MKQYTETELSNKIHTFLGKKLQKYPELSTYNLESASKSTVKTHRSSNFFATLENLNSLWAQRIHS